MYQLTIKKASVTEQIPTLTKWELKDVSFNKLNLIVGRNATGKSRTLKLIKSLAERISSGPKNTIGTLDWNIDFESQGRSLKYEVSINEKSVDKESLTVDGSTRLTRGPAGKGEMWYKDTDDTLSISMPMNELATYSRADPEQNPDLASIREWANSLYFLNFREFDRGAILIKVKDAPQLKGEPVKVPTLLFAKAEGAYEGFREAVESDIAKIGFPNTAVQLVDPVSVRLEGVSPGIPKVVGIQEPDLIGATDVPLMSDGMFSSLGVVVLLNYFRLKKQPLTLLIDDIGEGLDFERAKGLVQVILDRSSEFPCQVFLTSNDQFILDAVPFEHWVLLKRSGGLVRSFTIENSREAFERFSRTGLSNFDLLASDYLGA